MAPGRSAPMGGRFARWNGQERAPNREPSQGSTDDVRTSLSRVRSIHSGETSSGSSSSGTFSPVYAGVSNALIVSTCHPEPGLQMVAK